MNIIIIFLKDISKRLYFSHIKSIKGILANWIKFQFLEDENNGVLFSKFKFLVTVRQFVFGAVAYKSKGDASIDAAPELQPSADPQVNTCRVPERPRS